MNPVRGTWLWPRVSFAFLVLLISTSPSPSIAGETPSADWREIALDAMDRNALTPHGAQTLALPGVNWQQAQTPHFVLHYEQAIFARKVARMAEFFFRYIQQDFPDWKDQAQGRSHIFIFRNAAAWQRLMTSRPDVQSWTFSMVEGPVMYIQQAGHPSSSGDVLAHEMTHLVIHRFLTGTCPLWLNEGIAEFYGEFAYASFKGIKKSRRAQFRRLERPYPLDALLTATAYPAAPNDVQAFYATSKYLVGFLLLNQPSASFPSFVETLAAGADAQQAFSTHYGFPSLPDLAKAFDKFAR